VKKKRVIRKTAGRGILGSTSERLQIERERLFKAISIIECCRNATASQFATDDPEYMAPALDAARDLIHACAGELKVISDGISESRLQQ